MVRNIPMPYDPKVKLDLPKDTELLPDSFFHIPKPMTLDEMIAEYQWCKDNEHIWYYDCVSSYATWLKKKIDRLKKIQ